MGVGAKGAALGNANSVYVSGAEALFWNPAGISVENDGGTFSSGFISVNQYFVDVDIYGAGLVFQSAKNQDVFLVSVLILLITEEWMFEPLKILME